MTMHAANIERSERLQRVLNFLRQQGDYGATTRDIIVSADVCAVNSAVSELRRNGHDIRCTVDRGEKIFRYTLEGNQPGAVPVARQETRSAGAEINPNGNASAPAAVKLQGELFEGGAK